MLDDLRLREFLQLENPIEYVNLFTHVKEKKELKIFGLKIRAVDVNEMKFDAVSKVRKTLSKGLITPDDIIYVFREFFPSRLPKYAYMQIRVSSFYPCYNFILNSIRKIAEAESIHWSSSYVDPDYKKAGSEKLSKFAEMNIAIELAERYGQRPSDIFQWTYGEIFIDVAHNVVKSDVARQYQEIKADKYKR